MGVSGRGDFSPGPAARYCTGDVAGREPESTRGRGGVCRGLWPHLGKLGLLRVRGLFSEEVVYVAHATEETVVGREALASYIRKEAEDQGQASVRMGRPVIEGDHVAAEFWVTRSDEGWTTAGCFIAQLGSDGRCTFFREYWFDVEGHIQAYDAWGQ